MASFSNSLYTHIHLITYLCICVRLPGTIELFYCLLCWEPVENFMLLRFLFSCVGQYVFIETSSPRQTGDNAYLLSQPFDPTSSSGRCLKFWHHMKGASIGTLNVYLYTGNFSSMYLLWQRKGNKGDKWNFGQIPIRSSVKYQVKYHSLCSFTCGVVQKYCLCNLCPGQSHLPN